MNKFVEKSKGSTIYEAYWQELYLLSENWKSDLIFYQEDLYFSHSIINKYNKWISKRLIKSEFQEIEFSIFEQIRKCNQLLDCTNKHLTKIANTIETPYLYDSYNFRKTHDQMELELAQFIDFYRDNRLKVFLITEEVIENKELV